MKSAWIGLLLPLLLTGCGDDDSKVSVDAGDGGDGGLTMADAQAPDATLGSVTISAIERRKTMTGVVERAYSGSLFQVEGSDGTGGTIRREGTLGADGQVTITGVPDGELFYSYRSNLIGTTSSLLTGFFTRERTLDMGDDSTGGYGTGFPSAGTDLAFTLTGLEPWTASHSLRLLVPTHSQYLTSLTATEPAGITGFPVNGATGLTGLSFPWGRQFPDPTDQILLVQRQTGVQGVLSVTKIVKSFTLPAPTTLANGAPTQFTGALVDPPMITLPVRVDGRAWSAHVGKISPSGSNGTLYLRYFGGPPPLDASIEIANASMVGTTAAANVDLMVGDPFTGKRVLTIVKTSFTTVAAPGATSTVSLPYATIGAVYDVAALPATGPAPVLSPVESLRIGGLDARVRQSDVGVTPMLSWSPPAIGIPTHHEVLIEEVFNAAGVSKTLSVARLHTGGNGLRVPAGVLEVGKSYIFVVRADTWHKPNVPDRTYTTLPAGSAVAISALFTP